MEIKAEPIRYAHCSTNELLSDASVNVESWLMQKVSEGMRATMNAAFLLGDGVGKPLGLLNPQSGVSICDTSPGTQPGQISWQDIVMLKFEVPQQWRDGAVFLMNPRTCALLLTMSAATGRPLFSALPERRPGFMLAGSPVVLATQIPDVGPGATPILFEI